MGARRQASDSNVSKNSAGPYLAAPFGLHKHLVLTYDNTRHHGVGAQLHRIYGIYSISRLLGASYFTRRLPAWVIRALLRWKRTPAILSFTTLLTICSRSHPTPCPQTTGRQ